MSDKEKRESAKNASSPRRSVFTRARGLVALAVVVFALVGLVFHIGTGTPSALGIEQIAAICPLGALEALLGAKEFMLHPIVLLIATLVIVVVLGKAFCSWACPVPWLRRFFRPKKQHEQQDEQRAEHELAKGHEQRTEHEALKTQGHACSSSHCAACALKPLGGKRDGLRIDSRHAVLVRALVSTAVFGFPVFCLVCPIGLSFATLIGLWNLFRFNSPSWGLIIFPLILIVEVVFLRKWCSKICPLSALMSLVSAANKTLKPKVNAAKCMRQQGLDCHTCVDVCPEKLDPYSASIPECTKCGACVEACPAQAISIKLLALSDKVKPPA